jgi:hypothetical protein
VERDNPSPFADLISAVAWFALAAAIIGLSWRMDRLPHLQASIYSAPGLVPGLLGAALAIMAVILFARALRAGALSQERRPRIRIEDHWRLVVVFVLSLAFAIGILGSGAPFWLAAALYVAVFVLAFRRADAEERRPIWRTGLFSVAYGAVAGIVVHYVFQELFLVRLP